ncbi:YceI family protein [Ferruginibacter paludis]|uniref:YceI family protein n=1 Tax=Ferruginibacter paludis TaxID=1310417 RepID=UPI0025B56E8F|nr:YceI family protein [Ferruginibacter paludis]MDN3657008.1 YceI family protein [Ferruginibacter paludis]
MKKIFIGFSATIILAAMFAFTTVTSWKIADGYSIVFATNGVSGIFKNISGNILFDDQSLAASKFDIAIDINTINTGNGMQNKHAKSAEWFDAAKYPAIKFTSTKIVKAGAGYAATGLLQAHGISKEVSLPFTFKKTTTGALFEGNFNINRNDFKIGAAGGEVGDVIKVTVSLPVIK